MLSLVLQTHLPMKIRSILLNKDLQTDDSDILETIKEEHADNPHFQDLIADASIKPYASKKEVRHNTKHYQGASVRDV